MDETERLFLATLASAAIAYSGLSPAINQAESTSNSDTIALKADCLKIKCHGDFPVSSTRRYAEAKHDARNGTARI